MGPSWVLHHAPDEDTGPLVPVGRPMKETRSAEGRPGWGRVGSPRWSWGRRNVQASSQDGPSGLPSRAAASGRSPRRRVAAVAVCLGFKLRGAGEGGGQSCGRETQCLPEATQIRKEHKEGQEGEARSMQDEVHDVVVGRPGRMARLERSQIDLRMLSRRACWDLGPPEWVWLNLSRTPNGRGHDGKSKRRLLSSLVFASGPWD